MTLNDLKEELSAMGFENSIEADKNLILAVRRALATVYTERGVYKSFKMSHYPALPSLICKRLTHTPGETETFTLMGEAFSFSVFGSGAFSIISDGVKTVHEFDTLRYVWRGFISPSAVLEFFGDTPFSVMNLAVFEKKPAASEEKICVYGEPLEYSLSELVPDFHSFASLPTDISGKEIKGAILSSEKLLLPFSYQGEVNLSYKAAPPKISLDRMDEELMLPKETEHLTALLSAAYYWLDDDADKANFYLALYKDALKGVKQYDTRQLGGGYKNVTGWA